MKTFLYTFLLLALLPSISSSEIIISPNKIIGQNPKTALKLLGKPQWHEKQKSIPNPDELVLRYCWPKKQWLGAGHITWYRRGFTIEAFYTEEDPSKGIYNITISSKPQIAQNPGYYDMRTQDKITNLNSILNAFGLAQPDDKYKITKRTVWSWDKYTNGATSYEGGLSYNWSSNILTLMGSKGKNLSSDIDRCNTQ